ncbi:retinol dehydrogenase 14 [Rhypophila decipiens]|uniref:Retinol dehydrogenase 14 n=1 Tax=Rhypophila decipiens TaxID=261697 RepID=A0AAN6Y3K9_9PEZI|nr:retinol dehydrogenase 14 [Rhypophila decipiens]
MSSISALWHAKNNPPLDPTHLSFRDKAVLVTGANSGLGHAAAIKYAKQGANPLILAVRTAEKGETAKQAIITETNCSPDIFVILTLDLASFDSVRDFVARLDNLVPKGLHVAQLAAGVATWGFEKSTAGYEISVQVNVLSAALLAVLLLPILQRARAGTNTAGEDGFVPHLSFVNSVASMEVTKDELEKAGVLPVSASKTSLVEWINDENKFDNQRQYFLVKLAAWFVVQGLVERNQTLEAGQRVVINASDPGLCKTGMLRSFPAVVRAIMAVKYWILGRSVEEGARTMVSATGLGTESIGKLWRNDGYSELSELTESEDGRELGRKTWDGVMGILRAGGYLQ